MTKSLQDFILFDVAEIIVTDKKTKEPFLQKYLTTSGITQTSSETEIRGGRGAALLAMVESEKSLEINLGSATLSKEILSMVQGTEFKNLKDNNATIVITKNETLDAKKEETDDGNGNITTVYSVQLTSTPIDTTNIKFMNCEGEIADNYTALAGNVVELPEAFVEGKITAVYKTEIDNAEVLEIDAAKFPTAWELQMEVPAMDKCSNTVTHMIIFKFDNVRPSSAFDLSFSMGEPVTPELTLKVMQGCCSSKLGEMIIVPVTP